MKETKWRNRNGKREGKEAEQIRSVKRSEAYGVRKRYRVREARDIEKERKKERKRKKEREREKERNKKDIERKQKERQIQAVR